MCNDIFTAGVDSVFITASHGSQSYISMILEQNIPLHFDVISRTDAEYCYIELLKLICNYFLSPCGNESSQLLPRSICPEECLAVQRDCPNGWRAALEGLGKYKFIDCNDTSALLFPLPSCCIGLHSHIPPGTFLTIFTLTIVLILTQVLEVKLQASL